MKLTPHSLRLRFILGTSLALVIISMIYATSMVISSNRLALQNTQSQMAQEIELFMTFVDYQQGKLQVNAPTRKLRKKNFSIWIYATNNKLLWTSDYLPSFTRQISNHWLNNEGFHEIESPTPLQGSNSVEGKPLPAEPDNIFKPLDEYTYSLVVSHYGANPDAPIFRVVIIDTVPQEKQDNSVVWDTFKGVTLLNLFIMLPIVWLVAQWSLRPIDKLALAVLKLERTNSNTLEYIPPRELTRLVNNLNALLQQQSSVVTRYRHGLSDLAHSIKTPLAVLQTTFRTLRGNPQLMAEQEPLMQEQISRISQQIGYHLRRVVSGPDLGFSRQIHSVSGLLDPLCNALRKVYDRKGVDIQLDVSPEIIFAGEKNDFLEVVGNVIENACKYCLEFVEIQVHCANDLLTITVDDDGPGVPDNRRQLILQRGVRMDTLRPGQGIGLAVAVEIIHAYKGHIIIESSPLGGARFCLVFGHQT